MNDEIALFIDFENIRYSLINVQHREPDPQELIGVARHFGTVMVARAYADWQRQPDFFKGSLTAAMIDRVDCPAKVRERFRQPPVFSPPPPYDRFGPRDQTLAADQFDDEQQDLPDDELELDELDDTTDEPLAGQVDDEHGATESLPDDHRGRSDQAPYASQPHGYQQPQQVITQSTVDLNMLMDIIETVFDRPSINTFVLMSGDRDFTRICARLKLRLNKRVIVVGIPGTVSRDLISAAEQFIPLGYANNAGPVGPQSAGYMRNGAPPSSQYFMPQGPVEPDEAGFILFLDYIDKHWSWRTRSGVANFIGDAFNPKNRFRGRLTKDSARDLLEECVNEGILELEIDTMGNESLHLNRDHPAVGPVLTEGANASGPMR